MANIEKLQKLLEANEENDEELVDDEPFAGLDLRAAKCFGYSVPEEKCWKYIADQADNLGCSNVDVKQLERNLAKNVEQSYLTIAQFKLTDVDDDTNYTLSFDNNKSMWHLAISNSPKAELEPQQLADFFKSSMFKKIAKQTYDNLIQAKATFDNTISEHLENAELLLVDVVKLDAIMDFIKTDYFMQNLLNGKYLNY